MSIHVAALKRIGGSVVASVAVAFVINGVA